MDGVTLKGRAVVFALCAGAVAFFLALLVTTGALGMENYARALIPAIVCGVMCWASAERALSTTAAALDLAMDRMAGAGEGDLHSAIPPQIAATVPPLARSMELLFARLRTSIDRVERLAMFDTVTGLPNRAHARARAEEILAAMAPQDGAALFFVDLDRFKAVNDTRGHAAGDQLLAQVADRLRLVGERSGVPDPLIGRLAGDEFTLFFLDVGELDVEAIGRDILTMLLQPFDVAGASLQIGASVGVAVRPVHGTTLTELMRAADLAMYHAKDGGRGRVERYGDALATRIADRGRLDGELREAVEARCFELAFQPQVSLVDGGVVAAEALLRWRLPTGELRLPGSFIARAEETGLIVPIGDWVVDEVARTLARWAAGGVCQRLAINVSRRELDDPGFFPRLHAALRQAGAPATLLELEVGETLATQCGPDALAGIAALRAAGARIAIDQFGTGYTSIARLRAFPVDRLKLDRSLTEHIVAEHGARAVAQAVVALARSIGCETVGEGVGNAAQAEMLRVIGCDAVQGYGVAAPMDEATFLAWSAEGRAARAMIAA